MIKHKWQEKFANSVIAMSNKELLDATLEAASGDDYNGGFTNAGWWEFCFLKYQLYAKMIMIGFIPEDCVDDNLG